MASSSVRLWRDLFLPPPPPPPASSDSSPLTLSSPSSPGRCSLDGGGADDYIDQLASQMARNTLPPDDDDFILTPLRVPPTPKFWGLSVSPQSTLCEIERCGLLPDGDPFYDVAGAGDFEKTALLFHDAPAAADYSEPKTASKPPGRAEQTEMARKHGGKRKGRGGSANGGRCRRRHQKAGGAGASVPDSSDMVAIFLGGRGLTTGGGSIGGTGVFLPPGIGEATQSAKKPGCSTALVPGRVMRALKLNPGDVGGALCRPTPTGGNTGLRHHDDENKRRPPQDDRRRLPQDWSY